MSFSLSRQTQIVTNGKQGVQEIKWGLDAYIFSVAIAGLIVASIVGGINTYSKVDRMETKQDLMYTIFNNRVDTLEKNSLPRSEFNLYREEQGRFFGSPAKINPPFIH